MYLIHPDSARLSRVYFGYPKKNKKKPKDVVVVDGTDGEEGVEMIYLGSVRESCVYSMSP